MTMMIFASFGCERRAKTAGFSAFCAVLAFAALFLTATAKAQPNFSLPDNPTFKPEVRIQSEDYAEARRKFRTKLVRKTSSPQPAPMPEAPAGVKVVEFPSGDLRLKAWTNLPDKSPPTKIPAVIFLHGGFGFVKAHWEQAESYRNAGFIVLVPILRGENGQSGNFTLLYDEVDDVLAAADYLARQPSVDAENIFVAGHSIGGTLALLAAQASNKFRAAAAFSGSPDQQLLLRFAFPKDKIPFDASDAREFQMRSPLAYAASFKSPTRIYYGSEEAVFNLTSRRTAELAKAANLDVAAIVTKGNHESHVWSSIRQSIEFFEGKLGAKAKQALNERKTSDSEPCRAGNTTFRLKGFETAQGVALAGSFNEWNSQKLFFIKENGAWICRINLPPGKYFYKFVVDREWIVDPANAEKADDGNGNINSVLIVKP
jgi:dienelactone hydrolase